MDVTLLVSKQDLPGQSALYIHTSKSIHGTRNVTWDNTAYYLQESREFGSQQTVEHNENPISAFWFLY